MLLGGSQAILRVLELAQRAARSTLPVMITGETGTGKDVTARLIHDKSDRRSRPIIAINCANFNEGMIESELFGHERGAFTSAVSTHFGVFERADGGTVFLDEVPEMKFELQAKLLRVLEENQITRLGGHKPVTVNVRIIAATNRSPSEAVARGALRNDLYYRLNVICIPLPSLRERMEDLEGLAAHFIREINAEQITNVEGIEPECIAALRAHPWPGNVRELRSALAHAIVMRREGLLRVADLPGTVRAVVRRPEALTIPIGWSMDQIKREVVEKTLEAFDGNHRRAADSLEISPNTLYRVLNGNGRIVKVK